MTEIVLSFLVPAWIGAFFLVAIHVLRSIIEDWPDRTTPEEDAEQAAWLAARKDAK